MTHVFNKMKQHKWTIGKWTTILAGIASLVLILDSKTFKEFIAPWTSMPRAIEEIRASQIAHYKETDRKLNLLLSAQGILGIDEWVKTNNVGNLAKQNHEH